MAIRDIEIENQGNANYGSIPAVVIADPSKHDDLIENEAFELLYTDDVTIHAAATFGIKSAVLTFVMSILAMVALILYSEHSPNPPAALAAVNISIQPEQTSTTEYPSTFLLEEAYDQQELYYDKQAVDHLGATATTKQMSNKTTYAQRYYKRSRRFKGPGHPILLIMGGEAALELPMLYPFVNEGLAQTFGAFVISPEHRFYGKSQPVDTTHPSVSQMEAYLSPDQALEDALQLVSFVRTELGCHPDKSHPEYCPVLTFGGSYPGFLSAMLRYRYPHVIDGSYASSAPLELYSQTVDGDAYFDKITSVAEEVSAGCSDSVRSSLYAVREELFDSDNLTVLEAATAVGFCPSTFPSYMRDVEEFVSETIQYLVPAIFADFNMGYYPPGPDQALAKACVIFQDQDTSPMDKIRSFFALRNEVEYGSSSSDDSGETEDENSCFDVTLELPDGPNARIRGPDNSGSGGGFEGRIWDFQCCKDLVVKAGYSTSSMFLPRPFSYMWHFNYCQQRFPGMKIDPYSLSERLGFTNLDKRTTRIIFANGGNDGWFAASLTNTTALSSQEGYHEIDVFNFPNGAHHSELKGGPYPNPNDTEDILEGYQTTTRILKGWLDEIKAEQQEKQR